MDKWKMYMEIQQLLNQGFSKVKVADKLGISRTTVYRYLKRKPEDMAKWMKDSKKRAKKLDPYEDIILSWLRKHPDMSAAQIFDWLTEKYTSLEIAEGTVRLYVRNLRKLHDIPKVKSSRSYEALPEVPMGEQAQVDFGQTEQLTPDGKKVKLRFIAFVIANSRYKYKEWLDRPFTTRDVIRAHENAFQYFEGIPNELVYDQDALILTSENGGDLILTKEFQSYKEERQLVIWMCRRADPESKGKIENVVGFIKHNFAEHRLYYGLDKWNESGWNWLERTGNFKVHNTTKKRPSEVFTLEKQHLRPISSTIDILDVYKTSITRSVRKDNIIWYKSNRYTVPLGTFQKTKQVYIETIDEEFLLIRSTKDGPILAKHKIDPGKGKLIQDRSHTRDRTKGIGNYIETVASRFNDIDYARNYLEEIKRIKPRYMRDQLQLIAKQVQQHNQELLDFALKECMKRKLFGATDFIDMVRYLDRQRSAPVTEELESDYTTKPLFTWSESIVQTNTQKRDIRDYVSVLEGGSQ